jgi:hypothetical protein
LRFELSGDDLDNAEIGIDDTIFVARCFACPCIASTKARLCVSAEATRFVVSRVVDFVNKEPCLEVSNVYFARCLAMGGPSEIAYLILRTNDQCLVRRVTGDVVLGRFHCTVSALSGLCQGKPLNRLT